MDFLNILSVLHHDFIIIVIFSKQRMIIEIILRKFDKNFTNIFLYEKISHRINCNP